MSDHWTPVYDSTSFVLSVFFPRSLRPAWFTSDASSPMSTFQPGKTPFSTGPVVFGTMALYLVTVLGGRELMQRFKVPPQELKKPFLVHNILLSSASGLLLAVMLEEIVPIWYHHGFFAAICAQSSWTPRMEQFYILNYMFKFWELIDTGFLVLKKKPLAFLHVYHHAATALLCFSQLLGKTPVSWVVITLNLLVHVVMYAYYALTTLRIPCPWKRAVTTMQILQFILDLGVVYFASYHYFVSAYKVPLPNIGACAAGKEHAVFSGCAILTSYLFLFIAFYRRTYSKSKGAVNRGVSRQSNNGSRVLSEKAAPSGNSTALSAFQAGDAKYKPSTPQLEHAPL